MAAALQATTHGTQQGQMSPCAKTSVRVMPRYRPQKTGLLEASSFEDGGIGGRSRNARQERRPERDRKSCNGGMIDPALDWSRKIVEFGKYRAERPSGCRVTAIRAAWPPRVHEQRAHERDRRIIERVIALKETLDDRLAGYRFLPHIREGARVAQCFAGIGTLARIRQRRAASGAGDAPGFLPMLRDRAGRSVARVPICAGSANLRCSVAAN